VSLDKFALVMSVGGHMIRIVKIPSFTPLQGTILGWQVENIESVAAGSGPRRPPGKYPFARTRTSHLDHPRWKQSSLVQGSRGHILSVSQHVS